MFDPSVSQSGDGPGCLGIALDGPHAGAVVLAVDGEVDTLTAGTLEKALGELVSEQDATVLVVDLSGVVFLASSGLAVLIRAAHRAAERDLRLRLVAGSRAVRRPLEVTGSDQLFDLYDDRDAALVPPG